MKGLKTYIIEGRHKWDDGGDDKIYDFVSILFQKIEDVCGEWGLRSTYLRADGYHGSHGDLITWGHKESSRSFVKTGIKWRDDFEYDINIEFPEKIGEMYFDGNNVLSFTEIGENADELMKQLRKTVEQKLDYKKIETILYDLEDAVDDPRHVYIRAEGYHGSHGNVVGWLHYGVRKAIDNVKFWNDDYDVIIGVDTFGNKKMVNYLKKNCDFLYIDSGEVTITLDDIMNHFDELHDALS